MEQGIKSKDKTMESCQNEKSKMHNRLICCEISPTPPPIRIQWFWVDFWANNR